MKEPALIFLLAFMGGRVNESFDPTKLQFDDQFVNGAYSESNPTNQTSTEPALLIGMLLQD